MGYTKGLHSNNQNGLFSWLKKGTSANRKSEELQNNDSSEKTAQYEYDELKKKLVKVETKKQVL